MKTPNPDRVHTIAIDGVQIPVVVRNSHRATRLRLCVDGRHGLVLSLPPAATLADGLPFLESRRDWVRRHLPHIHEAADLRRAAAEMPLSIPFGGRRLDVSLRTNCRTPGVQLMRDRVYVSVPTGSPGRPVLQHWLRRRAAAILPLRVREAAQTHGQTGLGRISTRDQCGRWGSCSAAGNISLNWRLLLVPPGTMAYVILHELVHLRHHNHGHAFWRTVRDLCPQAEQHRRWLLTEGEKLIILWPPANAG